MSYECHLLFIEGFDKANFIIILKPMSVSKVKVKLLRKPIYASPSSGEAYRDRRLTINFEL